MAAALAIAPPSDDVERRASDTIRAYSAEGHHRTATAVDRASAEALLVRARATGAAVSLQPFQLSRVDPVAALVQIEDRRIEGLPMFDGAFTAAGGLRGAIGPIDGDQPFAWTRVAPNGEAALRKLRERSPHTAIVAVTMGGKPGLCPVNAGWFNEPFGPPVLQISSEHLGAIEAASASHAEIRVVAHATRQGAQAFNLVADVPGTDPALPPVCVMTPRSGWHANASERGGGLVCWLETLRAVVAANGPAKAGHYRNTPDRNALNRNAAGRNASDRNAADRNAADRNAADRNAAGRNAADRNAAGRNASDRNASNRNASNRNASDGNFPVVSGFSRTVGLRRTVRFVASSGHELGHLGLHDYLHRNPGLAHDALAWVHFGANIGTSTGDVGMTPSDDRLRDAALRALTPHGLEKTRQSPAAQVGGEAATIQAENGRFISFIGRNDWFHNPGDLYPDAADIPLVARYARAAADLVLLLANTPAV